jgi:hypothetical protein
MADDETPQRAAEAPSTAVAVPRPVRIPVSSHAAIMDTASFDHLGRVASVMAQAALMPESITHYGSKDDRKPLPAETVTARAFLIAAQASRWEMDPLAVMNCCAVVHGKLMYEGKLVYAVLESRLGVRLKFQFGTWDPKAMRVQIGVDPPANAPGLMGVVVSGKLPGDAAEQSIEGYVDAWKTTGANSPWTAPANWRRQLRYRGTREFANAYAPATVLGVLTEDEVELDPGAAAEPAVEVRTLDEAFGRVRVAAPAAEAEPAEAEVVVAEAKPEPTVAAGTGRAAGRGGARASAPKAEPKSDSQIATDSATNDFPGDRPAPGSAADVARQGQEVARTEGQAEPAKAEPAKDPAPDPKVVNLDERRGEVVTMDGEVIDTTAFNAFADAVRATSTWADFKGALVAFRDGEAFVGAPEELQMQAMLLAWDHASKKNLSSPEHDVAWFRLWLWVIYADEARKGEALPAFRKLMRGPQYAALNDTERVTLVGETHRAARDQ